MSRSPTDFQSVPRAYRRFEAGFTLLEMIVALAVLALGVLVALPLARGPGTARTLEAATRDVAGVLRLARLGAISSNNERVVVIDAVRGRIDAGGVAGPRQLGPAIRLSARPQGSLGPTPLLRIRFFPHGGASGGSIRFEAHGRSLLVAVDPLTGRVSMASGG